MKETQQPGESGSGAAALGAAASRATPRAPFDGVLFDCDGVLVDSEPITNGVLADMLRELGWDITGEECVRLFIGRALKDEWAVILEHTDFRIDDAWITEFRSRRDAELRERLLPIPGAREAAAAMLERFDGRIACATGADLEKANMQLSMTGLAPLFEKRVVSGMDQPRSKPAPDVFLAAAAALGIALERALVVEDSASGVTAGVTAGATVFGFSPAGPTRTAPEALLAAGAALVFERMDELESLVDQYRMP